MKMAKPKFVTVTTPSRHQAHQHHSAPRRGQALLLAVLLMVFIALLGATFVTVVALNMNQTARTEDKGRARQASQAAVRYVNDQMTNSPDGARWFLNEGRRAAIANNTYPPTATMPAANSSYYNNFERAQGWAGKFLKFPDPNRVANTNTPTFLARVELVRDPSDANATADDMSDNANRDKTGAFRITVIGLSPDDPAAFDRRVAYKGGLRQSPFGNAMWTGTNNTLATGDVPHGNASGPAVIGATSISLQDVYGTFPSNVPFYIVVGGPQTNTAARGLLVKQLSGANPPTRTASLTLAAPLTVPIGDRERVEIATALGAPTQLDNGTNSAPWNISFGTSSSEPVAATTPTPTPAPGGVNVLGGVFFVGNVTVPQLRSEAAGTAAAAATIKSSGLMAIDSGAQVTLQNAVAQAQGGSQATLATAKCVPSDGATFPGNTGNWTTLTQGQKDSIVRDAWNKIAGSTNPTRQTAPFMPPSILNGTDGVPRYRNLSKFAPVSSQATNLFAVTDYSTDSGLYSYAEGIYLDNAQDREKIFDTTTNRLREMTQSELITMWLSRDTTSAVRHFERSDTAAANNSTQASLEEMHLRGWVGPDEFHARGALVELDPTNGKVYITRDARSDNTTSTTTNSLGPAAEKTWKDPSGNPLAGVYRQEFLWPQNGVIFAEGNLRVRGGVDDPATSTVDPGRSITIVSMGNIYVEGSLNAGGVSSGRKVLLLARKNVVANPTALMARVDEQTLLSNPTTATAAANTVESVVVDDSTAFHVGDWIEVSGATTARGVITSIPVINNTTLNVSFPVPVPAVALPAAVRTLTDPVDRLTPGVPYSGVAETLYDFNQVLQRRFTLSANTINTIPVTGGGTTPGVRMAFRHGAWRFDGLTIGLKPGAGQPASALMSNNRAALNPLPTPQPDVVLPAQRQMEVELGAPVSSTDVLPTPTPPIPSTPEYPISAFVANINSARPITDPANPEFQYESTAATAPDYSTVPYQGLAGVGNRYDFSADPTVQADPSQWRPDIFKAGAQTNYTIPMATSIVATMNGAAATFNGAVEHASVVAQPISLDQFGFNFDRAGTEDALTSDQSFYRRTSSTTTNNSGFTLDSRDLTGAQVGSNTLALRFNDLVSSYYDTAARPMPYYDLSRLKVEDARFDPTTGAYLGTMPSLSMDVRAFVYAQEGSWFVIPGDFYDSTIRVDTAGVYYADVNNDGARTADETIDLNRDGTISPAEAAAVDRFRRYNYAISFTGSIMENQAPVILDVKDPITGNITTYGAVQDWTDKWATVTNTDATGNPASAQHGTIAYHFDPAIVQDVAGNYLNDAGFQYPLSPDLLYEG